MAKSMSIEDYKRITQPVSRSKYNNEMSMVDDINFDSKAEASYYGYLVILKQQGIVSYFLHQVPFILEAGIKYRLDFLVVYSDGRIDHVDIKGAVTDVFKIKKKQVEARYPIKIRCLKKHGVRFEEITV